MPPFPGKTDAEPSRAVADEVLARHHQEQIRVRLDHLNLAQAFVEEGHDYVELDPQGRLRVVHNSRR